MKLIPEKVGNVELQDLVIAGLVKYFGERFIATTPLGNGSLVSGGAKLGMAMFAKKYKPVALGLGIDAIEDILTSFLGSGGVFNNTGLFGGQGVDVI